MSAADNTERADRARSILNHFADLVRQQSESDESNLGDLLADLQHLCERDGTDFDACLNMGRIHFEAEQSGDEDDDED
jgi:hypothetical protein